MYKNKNGGAAAAVPEMPSGPQPVPYEVNAALAAAEAAEAPAPTPPALPRHPSQVGQLSREEMLEIENISLKIQNLGLQERQLQQDLVQANKMRHDLQQRLNESHKKLSEKYGIDLMAQTTKISDDGQIFDLTKGPKGAAPSNSRMMG